jgi:hypothetical protein
MNPPAFQRNLGFDTNMFIKLVDERSYPPCISHYGVRKDVLEEYTTLLTDEAVVALGTKDLAIWLIATDNPEGVVACLELAHHSFQPLQEKDMPALPVNEVLNMINGAEQCGMPPSRLRP